MPGNPLVRFDEGRVGRTRKVSPSLLLYRSSAASYFFPRLSPDYFPAGVKSWADSADNSNEQCYRPRSRHRAP
jgi:hypothetical protein